MPVTTWIGRLGGGVAVAIALAACGGSSLPSSTTHASGPSAAVEASPNGSLSASAQAFSELSDGLIVATEDLNRTLSDSPTPDDLRQAYVTYAALLERGVDELEATEFPTDAQADADSLRDAWATLSTEFDELSQDPTVEFPPEIETALAEASAAVTQLRSSLGLPPPQV